MEYKIVTRVCDSSGEWQESFESELNGLAKEGWRLFDVAICETRAIAVLELSKFKPAGVIR
jgi:hypothetical protein